MILKSIFSAENILNVSDINLKVSDNNLNVFENNLNVSENNLNASENYFHLLEQVFDMFDNFDFRSALFSKMCQMFASSLIEIF